MSSSKIHLLHPEELLDKHARGELSTVEQERLDAHLDQCDVCRFELDVRDDFAADLLDDNDLHRPVTHDEQANADRLLALAFGDKAVALKVDGSAERAEHAEHAEHAGEAHADHTHAERMEQHSDDEAEAPRISDRPIRRRRASGRILLLVAAALLVGGVATASGGGPVVVWQTLAAVWSVPTAPERRNVEPAKPASVPSTPVWASATTIAASAPPAAPAPSSSPAPVVAVTFAPPPAAAPPVVVESAASIFEAANQARRQGDYARAISLHRRLQASHPTSREAHASHATVGRLLLDRGDAAGALMSFDAYQSRGAGPLDESVMVGRATALERLGRTDEARTAWRALLSTFPETPYAEHARARSQ